MAHRIAALIVSVYIAALIYTNAFFIKALTLAKGAEQLFWNNLAIFLILLVPIYLLVNKYVSPPYSRGSMRHARVVLLSVALIGLVLAMLYHIIPLEPIFDLPSYVDKFFSSETALTLWLIIPLLALFI